MSYVALGAAFALTWYLLVNLGLSLMVAAATPAALRLSRRWSPDSRWRFLLGLRLAPVTGAALYVLAGCLPAYWRFEPRQSVEPVAIGLTLGAVGCAGLVLHAATRILRSRRRTAAVVRRWMRGAEPIALAGVTARAYHIREGAPVVSLIGVLRQRLVVAAAVPGVLTRGELDAVLAHELAHQTHRDNLWRLLVTASPDVLGLTPAAGYLNRAWANAAEQSADDRAAGGDPDRAADLASALVKLARLAPITRPAHAAGSMLFEDRTIADRVARLLHPAPAPRRVSSWGMAVGCGVAGAVLLLIPSVDALRTIHTLSERLLILLS